MKNPGLPQSLWGELEGRLWHATSPGNCESILASGEIKVVGVNYPRSLCLSLDGVSLFDFGPDTFCHSHEWGQAQRWLGVQHRERASAWIEVDRALVAQKLKSAGEMSRLWAGSGRLLIDGVEACHCGPIPAGSLKGVVLICRHDHAKFLRTTAQLQEFKAGLSDLLSVMGEPPESITARLERALARRQYFAPAVAHAIRVSKAMEDGDMTLEERNKSIVRDITEVIWNRADLGRIPEFYAHDYQADYRPYAPVRSGLEAIAGMVQRAHQAFTGYHEELRELLAEGDRVVARFTITGTQTGPWGTLPPSNRHASFDEIVILTLRDGKVVHQAGVVDNLSALRQLGVLPTPRADTAPAQRRDRDQMRSVGPEDEDRAGPEAPADGQGSEGERPGPPSGRNDTRRTTDG